MFHFWIPALNRKRSSVSITILSFFHFQYEGGVLEMFLTESQKHYYTAMKKLGRKKPQKVIKRPMNQFLAMFYDLSNSRRYDCSKKARS